MKTLKFTVVALLLSMFSTTTHAQTADDVINKYIKTIGGAEKMRTLKSIKMDMSVNAQGMEIPVEMAMENGGKMYVKIKMQGKEITQMAFDGATMWTTNFMTMKAEKSDAEATENIKSKSADFPDALLDYKSKGYSAEYIGKETKEGTECYKLKITKKPIMVNGVKKDDVTYYYFDIDNGLAIATETEIMEGDMKGQKDISLMSDYQEVEGFLLPFSMTQGGQEMKVKKITINQVIDQKLYTFPAQ